jgi:hypothetical protein
LCSEGVHHFHHVKRRHIETREFTGGKILADNTPQLDWSKNRLPNKAQPVPPIYQPEVVTKAVVFASKNRRREIYVGLPDRDRHRRQQGQRRKSLKAHCYLFLPLAARLANGAGGEEIIEQAASK